MKARKQQKVVSAEEAMNRASVISELLDTDKGLLNAIISLKDLGLLSTIDENVLARLRQFCTQEMVNLLNKVGDELNEKQSTKSV